ncbi:MAG: YbaB/EbfC family nucleoid-associated protein [Gammaproteobacteria bacterium]|nr:YbaB/EbfC family nucleoid-associated protein [Gammaproteobacteria bacterium]
MKGGIGKLMKQAQEMQANMQKAQEEMANTQFKGQSGGGLVTVVMTGRHDVTKVHIDNSVFSDDKEMLEDLIAAAVNDAVRNIDKKSKETLSGMTDGLSLPAGMKLPF